ncbi:MAG: protein kinase [Pyrinomonadaceae bacterium]|nr:protein kinase [Pyrinomonadaceae bacterium]
MNGIRWQQLSLIFHDALRRDGRARGRFVRAACGADESLRRQVESLLGSYEQAAGVFDEPAFERAARELAQEESAALIGHTIGQYRIRRLLGAGGMGEVYLADDGRLNRQVAVKLLPLHFAADIEQVRRFQLEARAASALNHPNILTIHETGEHENRHYIVMEYVAGATLREMMASTADALSLADVLDACVQVCDALSAAHEAGIVHRDIKPENIMLRPDGYVKVLDFGLAKLAVTTNALTEANDEDKTRNVETAAGVLLGTIRYMSPEQVRGLTVDERADVWSLGVVLYEMIENRAPFVGATTADTIVSILEREPAPFTMKIPSSLQKCALKALDKNRNGRFQTTREFADELKRIKRELGSADAFAPRRSFKANLSDTDQFAREQTAAPGELKTAMLANASTHKTKNALQFKSWSAQYWKRLVFGAVCAATLVFAFVKVNDVSKPETPRPTASASSLSPDSAQASARLYRNMNSAERLAFVSEQALRVSQALGDGATTLPGSAAQVVKQHVDAYDRRRDDASPEAFKETLNEIYKRAALYAPLLSFHFKRQNVPALVGIYIPMIESEYHDCLTSPHGAQGKFQFMEQTARNYGVRPEDRCNVDVIAPVAARYIKDRAGEFGTDAASMTLVIASFNRGNRLVKDDLQKLNRFLVADSSNAKPDFWFLLAHADELDDQFRVENRHYVPRFFAAAIIGENPQAFGLPTRPLSSLDAGNEAR